MSWYTSIYTGGNYQSGSADVEIKLYPNNGNRLKSCQKGEPLVESLRDALESLLDYGAIDYYNIERFNADQSGYNYPKIERDDGDSNRWDDEFDHYLRGERENGDNNNGTGANLLNLKGVHYFIHSWECTTTHVGGWGTYDCSPGSAFSTPIVMWMSDSCSSTGLVKNSSIQEALHTYILEDKVSKDYDGDGTPLFSGENEHSTGEIRNVNGTGKVTPMATYHATQDDVAGVGECAEGASFDGSYTTTLTRCTKEAIKRTGELDCK